MYLTDNQIQEMSQAAFTTYEVTADWTAARRSADEYARDEFGIAPRKSAVLLALKMARVSWDAATIQARKFNGAA